MQLDLHKNLGEAGFRYAEHQLQKMGRLATYIRSLPIKDGRIETWIPDYLDDERIFSFTTGGLHLKHEEGDYVEAYSESDLEDVDSIQALDFGAYRTICEYLTESSQHYFILKSHLKPKQASELGLETPFLKIGSELHLYCDGAMFRSQPSIDSAFDLLDEMFDHAAENAVGLLVPLEERPKSALTKEKLHLLTNQIDHLIIEAYAGENWLVWSRNRSASRPSSV